MKQIASFKNTLPEGHVTIDLLNPALMLQELDTTSPDYDLVLAQYLPYTKIFKEISILNFYSIPASLLKRLTHQYLHGASIRFTTAKRGFDKTYTTKLATPFYSYCWKELDLTKPIPKSLAKFKFTYNGVMTTYLDAVKTLTSTRYLPNDIWVALDEYSKQRIALCRKFNQGNYTLAELWYKQLLKDALPCKIYVDSPNQKTYYEAIAEIKFDKDSALAQLKPGEKPLTDAEERFLRKYAPMYGVEVPTFKFRTATRRTAHGYTEEPERVYYSNSNADYARMAYDGRNSAKGLGIPKIVRDSLRVHEYDCPKLLRDAYDQLMWLIEHLGDDALLCDYKRCPVCGEIYNEKVGCECGYCEPVDFIQADHLLYGIASTYEDYDSTGVAYQNLNK